MRISLDEALMENAATWAKRSTCPRLAVGAVVSRNGRSFATGYNGAPKGMPHCRHPCDCRNPLKDPSIPPHDADCSSLQPCTTAVHAELNALMFAARYGLPTEGAEIHTTHQPCLNCAMAIVNAGIVRVVFEYPYRDNGGLDLLIAAGVTAQKGV